MKQSRSQRRYTRFRLLASSSAGSCHLSDHHADDSQGLSLARAPNLSSRKRARLYPPERRDYAAMLRCSSGDLFKLESSHHPYLIQTLSKWSSKIQAIAPNTLVSSSSMSFKAAMGTKPGPRSLVDIIDNVLEEDAHKLLARTRLADDVTAGVTHKNDPGQHPTEIFDDADFYHQLLRDVIDSRGASHVEGKEWVRRQQSLKAKRKKTVDTRSSKGRKLRYEVHEKLQNFMVPVGAQHTWHEEQIDELFVSLLGN